DTETLRPTYRLLIGVPGVSNAFAISRRLGLLPEIIDQARSLISEEGMRFEELIQNVEKSRAESDRIRLETRMLRDDAARLTQQLTAEKALLADKNRQIVHQAREEARELYAEALKEVDQLLADIRNQQKDRDLLENQQLISQARQKIRSGLHHVENEIGRAALKADGQPLDPAEIRIGELYYAPALGLTGKIISGPDSRGNCVLQSGTIKVNVTAEALRLPETLRPGRTPLGQKAYSRLRPGGRAQSGRHASGSDLSLDRHMRMTSEIQLLGQTVEEAMSNLDKFIDDAVLAGMPAIRIVHGKGTGALRSAVQQMLKKDSRVKSFRLGAYGEGDSGVTLAELT
ncbi:MAG TPA: hypothetical protein DD640_07685, partial [Clostridiales bacterium]|nr:hypothetical protein [Clostridiales bacterium]